MNFVMLVYFLGSLIANTMDPDQAAPKGAAWSGATVFVYMIKYGLKCTWIDAADVKSSWHFHDK